jgi:LysM repeat protein
MTPDDSDRPRDRLEPRPEGADPTGPGGAPDRGQGGTPMGPSSSQPPYSSSSTGQPERAPWDVEERWGQDDAPRDAAWGAAEARAAEEARHEAERLATAPAGRGPGEDGGDGERAVAEARAIRALEAERERAARDVAAGPGGPRSVEPPRATDEPIVDPELAALARGAPPPPAAPRRVADIGMLDGASVPRHALDGPVTPADPAPATAAGPLSAELPVSPVSRGAMAAGPLGAVDRPYSDEHGGGRGRRAAGALLWFGVFVIVVAGAGVLGYGLSQYVAQSMAAPSPRPTPAPTVAAVSPSASASASTSPRPSASGAQTSPSPSGTTGPSPSSVAPSPSRSPRIHVVKRGENLTLIARMYDVTVEAIIEANDLDDPNQIEVGQELIIPFPDEEG